MKMEINEQQNWKQTIIIILIIIYTNIKLDVVNTNTTVDVGSRHKLNCVAITCKGVDTSVPGHDKYEKSAAKTNQT